MVAEHDVPTGLRRCNGRDGVRRIAIARGPPDGGSKSGAAIEALLRTPSFTRAIVSGFNSNILAAIDLEDAVSVEIMMKSAKSVGRLIGVLLVVQLAGFIVPFVMLHPITRGSRDWLANAAASSFQIKAAVFLLFANTALAIGIAIATWPVFRRYSERMALWLIALGVIMFALQAVDNAHVLSMVSLSQQSAQAGGPNDVFQTLAAATGATRRWVHYSELLAIDAWIFMFYTVLFRSLLVPRALAVFGLLTVVLHLMGVTLPLWLG